MNKRIKFGAGAISACLIVLSLMAIIPSPMARINLVMSAPTWDNYTRFEEIRWFDDGDGLVALFTENNTTYNVDVGEVTDYVEVTIWLKKEYADNWQDATSYTRVYMELEKPDNTMVFEDYINDSSTVSDYGTAWRIVKKEYITQTLTEGTWTLTTRYDAYV